MATKQVVLSDISGEELTDDSHAKVIVKHPDMSFLVELDMSVEEANKLQSSSLRLVTVTVHAPNQKPREATIETKVLDKLYGTNVNFDDILAGGRKATSSTPAPRATRATPAPRGEKVDYSLPENAGQLHRGRLTDAEIAWVQANKDKASANRERQTGSPIDWNDPAEIKRYKL